MSTQIELVSTAQRILDSEDTQPPPFFLGLLGRYLVANPYDTNFIVELKAGNGFGIATCLDDYCWKDVLLEADPDRRDGGKSDGFGSFFNYQEHCRGSDHVKGRNARLEAQGIDPAMSAIPTQAESIRQLSSADVAPRPLTESRASVSTSVPGFANRGYPKGDLVRTRKLSSSPSQYASGSSGPSSRPVTTVPSMASRTGSSHWSGVKSEVRPSSGRSDSETTVKRSQSSMPVSCSFRDSSTGNSSERKPAFDQKPIMAPPRWNNRDIIPSGSRTSPIGLDSDSDDEVMPLAASQVPADMRKKTNRDEPFVLDDDDDSGSSPLDSLQPTFDRGSEASRRFPLFNSESSSSSLRNAAGAGVAPFTKIVPLSQRVRNYKNEKAYAVNQITQIPTTRPSGDSQLVLLILDRVRYLNEAISANGMRSYEPPSAALIAKDPGFKAFKQVWGIPDAPVQSSIQSSVQSTVPPLTGADWLYDRMDSNSTRYGSGDRSVLEPLAWRDHFNSATDYASTLVPGAFPFAPLGATLASGNPLIPTVSGSSDLHDGEYDWGYEPDRPHDGRGLQDLFTAALEDFQEDTTVDDALHTLDLGNMTELLPGLKVPLLAHQVIGVSWMITMEKKKKCPGGILGDEMGLGKTVQTIATIVKNRSKDKKVKSTLIIVPLALMRQWKAEIEDKSDLTVTVYHGSQKTKSANELKRYDCILTTLGTVTNERGGIIEKKRKKRKQRENTADSFIEDDEDDGPKIKLKGLLFKTMWYRVVIDEASVIRNRNTLGSKSVVDLDSHIKWCLTGTLIYNSLSDIFPYLRFVGVIEWKDFRSRITSCEKRMPRLASKRAQVLLRKNMLRRNKQSTINGRPILQLPEKTVEFVEMDLSPEERAIYNAVELRARVKVNKFLKAGTVLKHYHIILVLLCRLRQLCNHPWLLRRKVGQELRPDDLTVTDDVLLGNVQGADTDDAGELARATQIMGDEWVQKVKDKLKKRYDSLIAAENAKVEAGEDEIDCECPICMEPILEAEMVTSCQHLFCAPCIEELFNSPIRDPQLYNDDQVARDFRFCPLCRSQLSRNTIFRADAFIDPEQSAQDEDIGDDVKPKIVPKIELWEDEPNQSSSSAKRQIDEDEDIKPDAKRLKKGKGKAKASDSDDEDEDDNSMENIPPSTKLIWIGKQLQDWHEADPSRRTLVFSSFVEALELLSKHLDHLHIPNLMYIGKLSAGDRDDIVREFTTSEGPAAPRVLLISLKCGGVGLNLTRASAVCMLDLAWTPAAELQAIDRAHRIGQTRPVDVKRLLIRDSVETRIHTLQQKKQSLADGAMGEGNGGRLPRLSPGELVALFGRDQDE